MIKHQNVDEEIDAETTEDLRVVRGHVTMMTMKMSKCSVRDQDLEIIVNSEKDPDLETILRDQSDQGQEMMIRLIDVRFIQLDYDPNMRLATRGQLMRRRVHLQCLFLKRLEVQAIVGSSPNRK